MIYDLFTAPTVCAICNALRQLVWKMLPLFIGIALLFVAYEVERRFFPVVKEFKITGIKRSENGVFVQGTLRKSRNCEFVQLSAYADDVLPIRITFLPQSSDSNTKTREVGFQLWGPWELASGKHTHIDMYARHQCHLLWQQTGKIVEFIIPPFIMAQER